ncbi:MAG: ATP-binding protein [Flexilinea sp.]|nr:ATP-binding protein [Flexilinea sp.]
MIQKEIIRQVILDYREVIRESELFKRKIVTEEKANIVLMGIRRGGKSSVMFLRIQDLVSRGIDWNQIAYINFEDERLLEMNLKDLESIIQVQNEFSSQKSFYFFDEIQIIEGWEHFARRCADMKINVWITGSNAKMLSREIESVLGGRYLPIEVYPYNFSEFLEVQDCDIQLSSDLGSRAKGKRKKFFFEYLQYGGFPESIGMRDKRAYLRNIYQKIYMGDIALRNDIRNDNALRILFKKIAESVMREVSYSGLYNALKTIGVDISKSSVINYISYAKEAYLIFSIQNFAAKSIEKESNPKYYFMDNGILNLFLVNRDAALLENLIAIALYRKFGKELFFFKGKNEVDFFVPSNSLAVQVSWSIQDPLTRKRETESLTALAKSYRTKQNLIVTVDESEHLTVNETNIDVITADDFLLMIENDIL